MMNDYWEVLILGATLESDEMVVRLEWFEDFDTENPVTVLRIESRNFSEKLITSLNANLFEGAIFNFQENESEKYVELSFDNLKGSSFRVDYSKCTQHNTSYTFEELTTKLKVQEEKHFAQSNIYSQENWKLRKIIQQLKQELWKELDRNERKSEFFAYTEKAIRFNERIQCYQKMYDWIELLEKE